MAILWKGTMFEKGTMSDQHELNSDTDFLTTTQFYVVSLKSDEICTWWKYLKIDQHTSSIKYYKKFVFTKQVSIISYSVIHWIFYWIIGGFYQIHWIFTE